MMRWPFLPKCPPSAYRCVVADSARLATVTLANPYRPGFLNTPSNSAKRSTTTQFGREAATPLTWSFR